MISESSHSAENPFDKLREKKKFRSDIVVIEDKEDEREVLSSIFKECGYRVLAVKDSRKTMPFLDSQKLQWIPEAVVLNLVLSGSSGYVLLRSMIEKFQTKKVPIIVVSSMGAEDDIFEAQTAGANAYVVTPFQPESLVDALSFALENIKKPLGEQKAGIYVKRPR